MTFFRASTPSCIKTVEIRADRQIEFLFFSAEAPASPSTRDAIQGMLSMANPPSSSSSSSSSSPLSISGGLTEGLGKVKGKGGRTVWVTGGSKKTGSAKKEPVIERPGKRPIKRPARHLSDEESPDEQETLGTCFKDSDYGEQLVKQRNSPLLVVVLRIYSNFVGFCPPPPPQKCTHHWSLMRRTTPTKQR